MSSAVRMKNGTASSAKMSMPENRYFGNASSGRRPSTMIAARVPAPSAKATGTPSANSSTHARNRVATTTSELRRVGVEFAVAEDFTRSHEAAGHDDQMHHEQRKSGRHRE